MPWGRGYLGHAQSTDGLTHFVYENSKAERVYWDSQCSLLWANRNNTNPDLEPAISPHPVTCFVCICHQNRFEGAWA